MIQNQSFDFFLKTKLLSLFLKRKFHYFSKKTKWYLGKNLKRSFKMVLKVSISNVSFITESFLSDHRRNKFGNICRSNGFVLLFFLQIYMSFSFDVFTTFTDKISDLMELFSLINSLLYFHKISYSYSINVLVLIVKRCFVSFLWGLSLLKINCPENKNIFIFI